jgi:hypothetical protein
MNYNYGCWIVDLYHEDRTHLGLAKDTPAGRPRAIRSAVESKIRSCPRLGGLHLLFRHRINMQYRCLRHLLAGRADCNVDFSGLWIDSLAAKKIAAAVSLLNLSRSKDRYVIRVAALE